MDAQHAANHDVDCAEGWVAWEADGLVVPIRERRSVLWLEQACRQAFGIEEVSMAYWREKGKDKSRA